MLEECCMWLLADLALRILYCSCCSGVTLWAYCIVYHPV